MAEIPATGPRIQGLPVTIGCGQGLPRRPVAAVQETLRVFRGQSADSVPEDLRAVFRLMARTWLPAIHCEAARLSAAGKPPPRPHFNHSLRTVSPSVEWLLPQQSAALTTTVESILHGMDGCRQRERPNRSYPRVTRRPDDRWRSSKKK